jgi:hypothetical protein
MIPFPVKALILLLDEFSTSSKHEKSIKKANFFNAVCSLENEQDNDSDSDQEYDDWEDEFDEDEDADENGHVSNVDLAVHIQEWIKQMASMMGDEMNEVIQFLPVAKRDILMELLA